MQRFYRQISSYLVAGALLVSAISMEVGAASSNVMQSNPMVRQAIQDLAERQSISPEEVEVVSVEEVVWPDTSMGCPHPGMRYAQVLQDGMRIILRVNGREYAYHSGGNRAPFLCDRKVVKKRPNSVDPAPAPDRSDL